MSALNEKLSAALESRRKRNILRRLPSPERTTSATSSHPSSSSPSSPSASTTPELVDFVSNDYLSLTSSPNLRDRVLSALHASPTVLGAGGSRLLVNPAGHAALEARLLSFFGSAKTHTNAALLFNSGFDANASVFQCVPQPGDVAVIDEAIHASVHDGLRASRLARPQADGDGQGSKVIFTFQHNSVAGLRSVLYGLLADDRNRAASLDAGLASVFVAVEALYSMDGTLAPLPDIVTLLEELFPLGNAHLIVDEAHSTGLYGPQGRGLVAHYGLEDKVFMRLHTFGKALASSGAVVLTSELVKSYLLNYARPLIYTTALSCANVVAINCSFDMLENGIASKLATKLKGLVYYTLTRLRQEFALLPPDLVFLPAHLQGEDPSELFAPIIPVMTPLPRPLSTYLRTLGLNARPITWPTVPKGKDRVRVCLHAGNTQEDVDRLVNGIVSWARREMHERTRSRMNVDAGGFIEAKL